MRKIHLLYINIIIINMKKRRNFIVIGIRFLQQIPILLLNFSFRFFSSTNRTLEPWISSKSLWFCTTSSYFSPLGAQVIILKFQSPHS